MTKVGISWELVSQARLPRKSSGGKSLGAHTLLETGKPGGGRGKAGGEKICEGVPEYCGQHVSLQDSQVQTLASSATVLGDGGLGGDQDMRVEPT